MDKGFGVSTTFKMLLGALLVLFLTFSEWGRILLLVIAGVLALWYIPPYYHPKEAK